MQDPINYINLEYFFRQLVLILTGQSELVQIPFLQILAGIAGNLRVPLLILCALFIASTVYSIRKLEKIRHAEHEILYAGHGHDEHGASPHVEENERWKKVVAHINSENPADWKVAVLEADIILDELVLSMGYHGNSFGERLKSIEPSDFVTLNDAWEAHKIRNQIAHQGSDYVLNFREARRVVGLYENVFREFKYI